MRKPDFLVAGASKTGTEWLSLCLREHPDVYVPQGPSPNYFSRHYPEGLEDYLELFTEARDERAVGEKSSYMLYPDVPERVRAFDPDMRLVFVLRNPIDRAYSHYRMFLRAGDVSEDVDAELGDESGLVKEGFYFSHIRRYFDCFPPEQIGIFLYDDLVENPGAFVGWIYDWLGVDASFRPEMVGERYHVTKARPRYQKVYNHAVSLARWGRRKSGMFERALEWSRKAGIVDVFHRLNEGKAFPVLSERRRQDLIALYRDDTQALAEHLGRDLSHWYEGSESQCHGDGGTNRGAGVLSAENQDSDR